MVIPKVAVDTVDLLQKIAQIVAFSFGGWWAYRMSGRTYSRRLQLELNASVRRKESRYYLLATIVVKNLGLRNFRLTGKKSALLISRLTDSGGVTEVADPSWEFEGWVDGLAATSIEPGLTIAEERLILLPPWQDDTLLLELRLVGHGRMFKTTKVVSTSSS
jgi:hypothetical protein